jgi:protein SCO1
MKRINYFIMILAMMLACTLKQRSEELPYYDTPDLTPRWKGDSTALTAHFIRPFLLINQDGKKITGQQLHGKIYVANFFFTTCASICPRMTANLLKVQNAFASDSNVIILSHTVLPETDSVPRLKNYAAKKGINSKKWWLLTGDKNELYDLARHSYFADEESGYDRKADEFLHTENCMLVDANGRIRGVYNATLELEIGKLISHIRILEKSGD